MDCGGEYEQGPVANQENRSIGLALTDTLDDLISEERIHPQLAMKILGNFDQAITEALQKNVKSRLQFKVNWKWDCCHCGDGAWNWG